MEEPKLKHELHRIAKKYPVIETQSYAQKNLSPPK